jgi:hypothetical protein
MWSWCGQVSGLSNAQVNYYLSSMNTLESEYPDVDFIYMTGHLDGSGESGTLNANNEKIRAYARAHNKILFDFADIESYDPDGLVNYMKLDADDNCDYDSDGDGNHDKNWATIWQTAHPDDWYDCGAAHSQPLNANQKAYAAWWLWARLGGWDGTPVNDPTGSNPAIYSSSTGYWHLDYNADGTSDNSIRINAPISGDMPVAGDWDGDGVTEPGMYRNSTGNWYLDYNSDGISDNQFEFGTILGDMPVVGDWDGDGVDEPGIYRNSNGYWYLDYNTNGASDKRFAFGINPGDTPVVGDWDGDGVDEPGIYRNSNGYWYLDYNTNGASDKQFAFGGVPGDMPVPGFWN